MNLTYIDGLEQDMQIHHRYLRHICPNGVTIVFKICPSQYTVYTTFWSHIPLQPAYIHELSPVKPHWYGTCDPNAFPSSVVKEPCCPASILPHHSRNFASVSAPKYAVGVISHSALTLQVARGNTDHCAVAMDSRSVNGSSDKRIISIVNEPKSGKNITSR